MSDPQPHLDLPPPASSEFVNPRRGRRDAEPPPLRNPTEHAQALNKQLDDLARSWTATASERIEGAQGHLATATAAEGTELPSASLGDKRTDVVVVDDRGDKALLHVRRDDLRALRRKVTAYGQERTRGGKPKNEPLVARVENLRDATLNDLVTGSLAEAVFAPEALYWVELWTQGGRLSETASRDRVRQVVNALVALSGSNLPEPVVFQATERDIYLAQLSGATLLDLPKLAPDVYRVAHPSEARADKLARAFVGDLTEPLDGEPPAATATAVTMLDTGVAEEHPLLAALFGWAGVSVVPGVASAIDQHGHGTELAGVAAFRDLSASILSGSRPVARAHLESILCFAPGGDPPLWALRTELAVEAAESSTDRRRVFNLALSDRTNTRAERSAWSTALDRLAHNDEKGRLICTAIGNAPDFVRPDLYPVHNMSAFVHDPAHAVNAITVGAITDRDALSDNTSPLLPVAAEGEISPYTSTNASADLPIKPEIAMEGGNACPDGTLMNSGEADLSLLTTDREHAMGKILSWTWATSAACAAASGLTAEIWSANPGRATQTVRALLVNSARWTDSMLQQHPDRKERLRAVGYGKPRRDRALASTRECPTLIHEGRLAPEVAVGTANRGMQLLTLPLPESELLALGEYPVELAITLSYFGEPNEARRWRYLGGTLGWDLQRRAESTRDFRKRVDDSWRGKGVSRPASAQEWDWEIGPQARGRGTVQGDRLHTDAASLAGDKLIAVWPVSGWWADHPDSRGEAEISYSIVITIDAGSADIDLYNLISSRIKITVDA